MQVAKKQTNKPTKHKFKHNADIWKMNKTPLMQTRYVLFTEGGGHSRKHETRKRRGQ